MNGTPVVWATAVRITKTSFAARPRFTDPQWSDLVEALRPLNPDIASVASRDVLELAMLALVAGRDRPRHRDKVRDDYKQAAEAAAHLLRFASAACNGDVPVFPLNAALDPATDDRRHEPRDLPPPIVFEAKSLLTRLEAALTRASTAMRPSRKLGKEAGATANAAMVFELAALYAAWTGEVPTPTKGGAFMSMLQRVVDVAEPKARPDSTDMPKGFAVKTVQAHLRDWRAQGQPLRRAAGLLMQPD